MPTISGEQPRATAGILFGREDESSPSIYVFGLHLWSRFDVLASQPDELSSAELYRGLAETWKGTRILGYGRSNLELFDPLSDVDMEESLLLHSRKIQDDSGFNVRRASRSLQVGIDQLVFNAFSVDSYCDVFGSGKGQNKYKSTYSEDPGGLIRDIFYRSLCQSLRWMEGPEGEGQKEGR